MPNESIVLHDESYSPLSRRSNIYDITCWVTRSSCAQTTTRSSGLKLSTSLKVWVETLGGLDLEIEHRPVDPIGMWTASHVNIVNNVVLSQLAPSGFMSWTEQMSSLNTWKSIRSLKFHRSMPSQWYLNFQTLKLENCKPTIRISAQFLLAHLKTSTA